MKGAKSDHRGAEAEGECLKEESRAESLLLPDGVRDTHSNTDADGGDA